MLIFQPKINHFSLNSRFFLSNSRIFSLNSRIFWLNSRNFQLNSRFRKIQLRSLPPNGWKKAGLDLLGLLPNILGGKLQEKHIKNQGGKKPKLKGKNSKLRGKTQSLEGTCFLWCVCTQVVLKNLPICKLFSPLSMYVSTFILYFHEFHLELCAQMSKKELPLTYLSYEHQISPRKHT